MRHLQRSIVMGRHILRRHSARSSGSRSKPVDQGPHSATLMEDGDAEVDLNSLQKQFALVTDNLPSSPQEDPNIDEYGANRLTGEVNGPKGKEPTRFGDWERKGRVSDF